MFTSIKLSMYLIDDFADFVFCFFFLNGLQFDVNLKETLVNENGRRDGSVRRLNGLSNAKLSCQWLPSDIEPYVKDNPLIQTLQAEFNIHFIFQR